MTGSSLRRVAPIAGAVLLTIVGMVKLVLAPGFWPPAYHFERWPAPHGAADFAFLSEAASVVPAGASVVALTAPPDLERDNYLHRLAVALLPGRRVVPAAMWSASTRSQALKAADFIIVVGGRPNPPPGRELLTLPAGSVWRRR